MSPAPLRPELALSHVAALTREHWGLAGELRELGSYADRNFLIRGDAGQRHVFKITAEASESREVIELQGAALMHLSQRPSGTLVPQVIPSLDGRPLLTTQDEHGQRCTLRVLSWLSGQLWSELDAPSPALLRSFGRALGQLDHDLEGFVHPAMERSFPWNLAEAEWIADELSVIKGSRRRELVSDALAQFSARVIPRLPELPRQLIHGDANDQNLVVEGDELRGIFDFGDTLAAPAIFDLAIALAYLAMVDDPAQACAEVCAGYHQRRPLSSVELDLLFDLMRMRLAVSVVSSTAARAREPDNPYYGPTEDKAWMLLEALAQIGRPALTQSICAACELPMPARAPGARGHQ